MEDLKKMSDKDLTKLVLDTRKELTELRFKAAGAVADPKAKHELKLKLARALTELNQRSN